MNVNAAPVKFIGAWICIILSIVFLVLGAGFANLPLLFAVLACSFALAPATL